MSQVQVPKRSPFTIERKEGKAPGTVIFRFSGPFTARDMFESLPPAALQKLLDFQSVPGEELPVLNILDLTDVPYIDSSGLGTIVRHYVHCQGKGVRFVTAGASMRVLELFKITKVDGVLPLAASVADADTSSN
jgi:anti-anti-sigma regulatory factor